MAGTRRRTKCLKNGFWLRRRITPARADWAYTLNTILPSKYSCTDPQVCSSSHVTQCHHVRDSPKDVTLEYFIAHLGEPHTSGGCSDSWSNSRHSHLVPAAVCICLPCDVSPSVEVNLLSKADESIIIEELHFARRLPGKFSGLDQHHHLRFRHCS